MTVIDCPNRGERSALHELVEIEKDSNSEEDSDPNVRTTTLILDIEMIETPCDEEGVVQTPIPRSDKIWDTDSYPRTRIRK